MDDHRGIILWSEECSSDGERFHEKAHSNMIFTQCLGYVAANLTFIAGPEWQEFVFPFDKFNIDGSDIMGIFIGASQGE
jgi:hypothetical protein